MDIINLAERAVFIHTSEGSKEFMSFTGRSSSGVLQDLPGRIDQRNTSDSESGIPRHWPSTRDRRGILHRGSRRRGG